MTTLQPDIGQLVSKVHANIDNINEIVQSMSGIIHSQELDRLSIERESAIHNLRVKRVDALKQILASRAREREETERKRRQERKLVEEKRLREWQEILAKRMKEDEVWQKAVEAEDKEIEKLRNVEDEEREKEREEEERFLFEKCEGEIERLQTEIQNRVVEGKLTLQKLDEERKIINSQIEAALSAPSLIPEVIFQSRRPKTMLKHESYLDEQCNKNPGARTPKYSCSDSYPVTSDTVFETKEKEDQFHINQMEPTSNNAHGNIQHHLWQKAINAKSKDEGEYWHLTSHANNHEHKELRLVTILQKEMNGSLWKRPFSSLQKLASQEAVANTRDIYSLSTHSRRFLDSKVDYPSPVAESSCQKSIKSSLNKDKLCEHLSISPKKSAENKTGEMRTESESIDMAPSNCLPPKGDEFIPSDNGIYVPILQIHGRNNDDSARKQFSSQSCQIPKLLLASQESILSTNAKCSLEESNIDFKIYSRTDSDCPESVNSNLKKSTHMKLQVGQYASSSETSSQDPERLLRKATEIQDNEYIGSPEGLERKNAFENNKKFEEAGTQLNHSKQFVDNPLCYIENSNSIKSSEALESSIESLEWVREQVTDPIISNHQQCQFKEPCELGKSSDTNLFLKSSSPDGYASQIARKGVLDFKLRADARLPHEDQTNFTDDLRITGLITEYENPLTQEPSIREAPILVLDSQSKFYERNIEIEAEIPINTSSNNKSSEIDLDLLPRGEKFQTNLTYLTIVPVTSIEETQITKNDTPLKLDTHLGLTHNLETYDREYLNSSSRCEMITECKLHPDLLSEPISNLSSRAISETDYESNFSENPTPISDSEQIFFSRVTIGEQSLTTDRQIRSESCCIVASNEPQIELVTKCEVQHTKTQKKKRKVATGVICPDSVKNWSHSEHLGEMLSKKVCKAISCLDNQLDKRDENSTSEIPLLASSYTIQTLNGIKNQENTLRDINQSIIASPVSNRKSSCLESTNSTRNTEDTCFASSDSPSLPLNDPNLEIKISPDRKNLDDSDVCGPRSSTDDSKYALSLVNSRIKLSISRDLAAIYGEKHANDNLVSNAQPSSALLMANLAAEKPHLKISSTSNAGEKIFNGDVCKTNNIIIQDDLRKNIFQKGDIMNVCLGRKDPELTILSPIGEDKSNDVIACPLVDYGVHVSIGCLEAKSNETKISEVDSNDTDKDIEIFFTPLPMLVYESLARNEISNYDETDNMNNLKSDKKQNNISSKFPDQFNDTGDISTTAIERKDLCHLNAPQFQDPVVTSRIRPNSSIIHESIHSGSCSFVVTQGFGSRNFFPHFLSYPGKVIQFDERYYKFNISIANADISSNFEYGVKKYFEFHLDQNNICSGLKNELSQGNHIQDTRLLRFQSMIEKDRTVHSIPQFEADLKISVCKDQLLVEGVVFGKFISVEMIQNIQEYKTSHVSPYTDLSLIRREQLDCDIDLVSHKTEIQFPINSNQSSEVNYESKMLSEGSPNYHRNKLIDTNFRRSSIIMVEEMGLCTASRLSSPCESSEGSDGSSPTMNTSEASSSLLNEGTTSESILSTKLKSLRHIFDVEALGLKISASSNGANFDSRDCLSCSSRSDTQDDCSNMPDHIDYDFWRDSSFRKSPESLPSTNEMGSNIPLPARARFEYQEKYPQIKNRMRNKSDIRPLSGLLSNRWISSKPNRRLNLAKTNSSITSITEDRATDDDSSTPLESFNSKEISSDPSTSSDSSQLLTFKASREFQRKEQSRISFFEGLHRATVISPSYSPVSPIRVS